ncbi:MAG: GMC family oxidoreductase [Planctomycetaceae bacterium]|nr:GMC family oxidoreductase [Planctomycetaceae bacterium]
MTRWDAIVIGSGFGGAVTACRLAERGLKVLVLERGRRWSPETYPRGSSGAWIWDQNAPRQFNGWVDLRLYRGMAVAQGAAVGGGSLIYANVSVPPNPDLFDSGWPEEITFDEMSPYFDRVGKMLNVQTIPENQLTERFKLVREAAEKIGAGDRFRPLPLAVTFDPEWDADRPDPTSFEHSRSWINDQGQEQGTCVHCGDCCTGCVVKAKNTLDLNYIPLAEQHGAEVRPLHLVQALTPVKGGYQVDFQRLDTGQLGMETSERVILAAGSLGSTEILLRSRDEHCNMPGLSLLLGKKWSSNGDFLTPGFYRGRRISPTHGPTISSAIDFLDGSEGPKFFIEDGGWPDVLRQHLETGFNLRDGGRRWQIIFSAFGQLLRTRDPQSQVMPWFAQGVDAGDGELSLRRIPWQPWRKRLHLKWRVQKSRAVIDGIVAMHQKLAAATDGRAPVPPAWQVFKWLVTPHPLGGCVMGTTADDGVVNHAGEVFGYRGLYVADGAIIPKPIGLTPSRTIAGLAERISDQIVAA